MNTKLVKNLNPVVKNGLNFVMANRPEFLAGGAVVGLGATVFFTGRAAIQLSQYRLEYSEFLAMGTKPEQKTVIKDVAKIIAPAAEATLFTGACIVGSSVVAHHQYGALMAAYLMSNDKLKAFESKAAALLGEAKTDEVRAEIAQERIVQNGPVSNSMIIDTGHGNTIVYDTLSGRYFKSSIEKIRMAQNDLNEQIISDWCATLNEFYNFLGLKPIKLGDNLGWNTNNLLRVTFDSALLPSGEPVVVLDYEAYPEYRLL